MRVAGWVRTQERTLESLPRRRPGLDGRGVTRAPSALPYGRLVELRVGVRQGSTVAACAAHGEGRAGPAAEHLSRHGVQRAGQAWFRARCVWVRDHVGESGVVRAVRPGQRRFQCAQRRRAGSRRCQEARVGWRLCLRRRAMSEEVIVASRGVVVTLVVCGKDKG